jgi:glutathione S-transferase
VRRALADLGVEVEMRDVQRDAEAHAALVAARGRGSVPVLYIEDTDTWMPESGDIVRWLYARFGNGRKPPLRLRLGPQLPLLLAAAVLLAWLLWGG